MPDFYSQVTRAIIGHNQIKTLTKQYSPNIPFLILLKEFIKNSFQYPNYALALIFCYSMLPYIHLKTKKSVSYIWQTARSTKE
jgi:hypothetical protein